MGMLELEANDLGFCIQIKQCLLPGRIQKMGLGNLNNSKRVKLIKNSKEFTSKINWQ